MKILLIHNRYSSTAPGGEDVVVDAERRSLEAAGLEVVAYERSLDELGDPSPLDLLTTSWVMQDSARTRYELGALIARERPDLAHVHNVFPLISASAYAACAAARLPVVQTVHNYRLSCAAATHYRAGEVCESCSGARVWPAIQHGCFRRSRLATLPVAFMQHRLHRSQLLQRAVTRFLALSEFARTRLLDLGLAPQRVVVRDNFIELPTLEVARASLPYAVFSGRLSDEKGILTLLEAWQGLTDLPLKILGDGRLREQCERFVTERALPVQFLGNLPRAEALRVVGAAALQIVPSRWFEGMPLVILEAWALGVPVIASRLGGMAEMIGDDERGLGFTPGDAEALQHSVRRLLQSPDLAATLRAAGRARYAERHTPQRGLTALLEQYRQVLGVAAADRLP